MRVPLRLSPTRGRTAKLNLQCFIGEAVNRLSSNFVDRNPQFPIRQIRGMRNRVVHEYKEVDLEILWQAIQTSIPELLVELKRINGD